MNSFEMLLAKPFFQALGWALVHFIWQGAVVAGFYAMLAGLLRRRSANVRYSVACVAMALMLVLPIATTFIIDWYATHPKRTLVEWYGVTPRFADGYTINDFPADGVLIGSTEEATTTLRQRIIEMRAEESAKVTTIANGSWRLWAKQRFSALVPWLVALWFVGVLFLSFRFLGGLIVMRRLKRREASPMLEQWQERLAALCQQLRVSRPVRLCESVLVEVPTVIGWLRPIILVPATALTGLSAEQLEALLAHELAHVRRYDYLVNLVQTAVETLLFYHPAVWWLSSQIRQERENCCDDLAVATCGNVLTYARALTELEVLRVSAPQLAVAASGGALMQRIQRLIGSPAKASHRVESWLAGVIVLATVFCIFAGAQTAALSGDSRKSEDKTRVETGSIGQNSNRAEDRKRLDPSQATPDQPEADEKAETAEAPETPETPESAEATETPETPALNQAEAQQESGSSADLISGLAAEGYTNLSVDDLIDLKTHDVSPAFIHEMNAYFKRKLSVDDLTAMRIHGLTPQIINDLKAAGVDKLSADDAVAFQIHGVTPQYINEWKAAGYDHLSADDLTAFRIHGVTPEFAAQMKSLGIGSLEPDDLIAFKIHGVTPDYVQTMRGYIHGNLSADDLTACRIHGVTPEFIKELEAIGETNLSADDLTAFRIHGVTPNFIKAIQSLGFKQLKPDDLIALRVHNITPEFIETVRNRGFKDVTLEQVIELKRMNILPGARNNQ